MLELDEVALVVVLEAEGHLAEIPDVPLRVLGVPVDGILDQNAISVLGMAHDLRGNARDLLGFEGDEQVVALDDGLTGVLIDLGPAGAENGSRLEREERVVDRGAGLKPRRVEVRQDRHQGVLQTCASTLGVSRDAPVAGS